MTSKEKATELVARMKMYQYPNELEIVMAKASANIACDTVIDMLESWRMDEEIIEWWNEVKKEIDLL